jgi:hypothetical protein
MAAMPPKNQGSPVTVIIPNATAWANALAAAGGDERRLLTIDPNTVMTYNSEAARIEAQRRLRRTSKKGPG